jgi:TRAP-type uncharacterized transport system fused permease subunit
VSGYFLAPLSGVWRLLMAIGGLFLVAPSLNSDILALVVMSPALMQQLASQKRSKALV